MKKESVVTMIAALAFCATCSWLSYRCGVVDGFRAAAAPGDFARFHTALSAIQHLRANEVAPVIDRLETSCYAGADYMLELNYQRGSKKELEELVAYRARYAKPSGQWSPVEADLENRLKLWQSDRSTELALNESELVQLACDVKQKCR